MGRKTQNKQKNIRLYSIQQIKISLTEFKSFDNVLHECAHNICAISLSQKLRLFSMDSGCLLPIDQTVDALLQNETFFNGGTVILERVTDEVNVINTELYQ